MHKKELKKATKVQEKNSDTINNNKPIVNSVNRKSILPVLPGLERIISKRKYQLSPTSSDDRNVLIISSTKTTKSSTIREPSPKRIKKDIKATKSIEKNDHVDNIINDNLIPSTNKKRKTLKELKRHVVIPDTKNIQTIVEHDHQPSVVVDKLIVKKNNSNESYKKINKNDDEKNKKLVKQLFKSNDDWSSDSSD